MKGLRLFYLVMAVLGTIVPWWLFGQFFVKEGVNIPLFVQGVFVNGAAGGFTVDVLLSIVVFLVWATGDAQKNKVVRWWLIFPASFTVGLSLALPLYLFLREE